MPWPDWEPGRDAPGTVEALPFSRLRGTPDSQQRSFAVGMPPPPHPSATGGSEPSVELDLLKRLMSNGTATVGKESPGAAAPSAGSVGAPPAQAEAVEQPEQPEQPLRLVACPVLPPAPVLPFQAPQRSGGAQASAPARFPARGPPPAAETLPTPASLVPPPTRLASQGSSSGSTAWRGTLGPRGARVESGSPPPSKSAAADFLKAALSTSESQPAASSGQAASPPALPHPSVLPDQLLGCEEDASDAARPRGPPMPGFASIQRAEQPPQPGFAATRRLELDRHLSVPEERGEDVDEASQPPAAAEGRDWPEQLPRFMSGSPDRGRPCQNGLHAEGDWREAPELSGSCSAAWMPLGMDGHLLLCLGLEGSRCASLLPEAEELLAGVTGCDPESVMYEDLDSWYVESVLHGCHPDWEWRSFTRAVASVGMFAGMAAVGSGATTHDRRRTARLALALATVVEYPHHFGGMSLNHYPPAFFELLGEVQGAPVLPVPPRDRTDSNEGELPCGVPAEQLFDDPYYSSTILQSMARSSRLSPPDNPDASDPRLRGVPEECLKDPFMELRVWDEINGPVWWPHCTLCNVWSNVEHLGTRKHLRLAHLNGGGGPMTGDAMFGAAQASATAASSSIGARGFRDPHGGFRDPHAGPSTSVPGLGSSDEEIVVSRQHVSKAAWNKAMRKEHLTEKRAMHRAERRRQKEEMAASSGMRRAPPPPTLLNVFDWSYSSMDADWAEAELSQSGVVEI